MDPDGDHRVICSARYETQVGCVQGNPSLLSSLPSQILSFLHYFFSQIQDIVCMKSSSLPGTKLRLSCLSLITAHSNPLPPMSLFLLCFIFELHPGVLRSHSQLPVMVEEPCDARDLIWLIPCKALVAPACCKPFDPFFLFLR